MLFKLRNLLLNPESRFCVKCHHSISMTVIDKKGFVFCDSPEKSEYQTNLNWKQPIYFD